MGDLGGVVIPVLGMITGMMTTGAIVWGIVQIVKVRTHGGGAPAAMLEQEVSALRDQMDHLSQQLTETQERVEFTERLLSRGRTDSPGEH
ncbi:MAG: hypothetical protein ABI587_14035 [Gemmatimonadales bacterium]